VVNPQVLANPKFTEKLERFKAARGASQERK